MLTLPAQYELDGSVEPFGKDFQMRAGDAKARTADPQGAVKWKCINSASEWVKRLNSSALDTKLRVRYSPVLLILLICQRDRAKKDCAQRYVGVPGQSKPTANVSACVDFFPEVRALTCLSF